MIIIARKIKKWPNKIRNLKDFVDFIIEMLEELRDFS